MPMKSPMPSPCASTPVFFRLVVALALVATAGCGGKDQAAAQPRGGGDRDRPVPVTTQVLRAQPWSDTLQAIGTVRARESITVSAKVSEIVQRVHFDSGDEVARGEVLVTLGGQAQQAGLAEAQAAAN